MESMKTKVKGHGREAGIGERPSADGAKALRRFSSEDLQKRIGEVTEVALFEPVEITYHGRARHVLMSVAEYRRLREPPPPQVFALKDIPDEVLSGLANATMAPHDPDKD